MTRGGNVFVRSENFPEAAHFFTDFTQKNLVIEICVC